MAGTQKHYVIVDEEYNKPLTLVHSLREVNRIVKKLSQPAGIISYHEVSEREARNIERETDKKYTSILLELLEFQRIM